MNPVVVPYGEMPRLLNGFCLAAILMIVDVRLGSGSGIAAVAAIAETVSIPHIFVSGGGRLLDRRSSILLQKPFSQRKLLGAIEQAITVDMGAPYNAQR